MKRVIETVIFLTLTTIWVIQADGSAIPMWEFLSKEEKMSRLYQLFSQQVVKHCQDSSMPDCNKNLLIIGLRQLVNLNDNDILDRLDPYQRGAEDLIWRTMIGNNKFPFRSAQEIRNSYYTSDGGDSLATSGGEHNGLSDESHIKDYVKDSENTESYLVGPMVFRVFPDGRPVPIDEQQQPLLKKDDDLNEFKYPRIPSIREIQTREENKNSENLYGTKKESLIRKSIRQRFPLFIMTSNDFYQKNLPLHSHRMLKYFNKPRALHYSK